MTRLIPAFCILLLAAAAQAALAGGPSKHEIQTAVQAQLRASAQQQIDYMRKVGGEDSIRLARQMGTLVKPEDISVSNLVVDEVAETDRGDFDARTRFDLAVGDHKRNVNAKVRLRGEADAWRVISLEKY